MADRRPGSHRMEGSRRRAECARAIPEGADALGHFSDALSVLNVARHSPSAKENARPTDGFVAVRYASDALTRIYGETDRRLKCPDTGWLGFR